MIRLFRRRKFILDRKFQYSLMAISFGYAFVSFAIIALALFAPLMLDLSRYDNQALKAIEAADIFLYLHSHLWLAVLFSFLLVGLHSVRTSHRIAGPLYRLNMIVQSIGQGKLPAPLRRPRKGDYFVKEIDAVNEMIESLRERTRSSREAHADLAQAVSRCRKAIPDATREELADCLEDLTEKAMNMERRIGFLAVEE